MKERDLVKKITQKSPEKWSVYKQLRNKVTKEIKVAIETHCRGLIEETKDNPKKMWKTINRVLDKSPQSITTSCLDVEGNRIKKEADIAEALNHHFVTVGPKLAGKVEQRINDDPLKYVVKQSSVMKFTPVSDIFILNSIKQLKNGKAPGPEKIPTLLIKDAGEVICKQLAMIVNSSLRHGIFPDIWKLARVTPIFKSGSRSDTNNYRPISVISVFSRILERIVHDQIYDYLRSRAILTIRQSAVQKLCSTVTSLIDSTEF